MSPDTSLCEVSKAWSLNRKVGMCQKPGHLTARFCHKLPKDPIYRWNGYLRKGQKMKPKRQNQTRNGKAWKRQSQDKAQV
ncbi:hypothetical protein Tco_0346530 [Tanacetum coccineum]